MVCRGGYRSESNRPHNTLEYQGNSSHKVQTSYLLVPLLKAGRNDHPLKLNYMPPGFYEDLSYTDGMNKYHEDCVAGIRNQHHQDIKNKYCERCKTFWIEIQRRYIDDSLDAKKLDADTEENDLLEKLDIVF